MYVFDDPEKVAQLGVVLREWEGTPYRYFCGVKGKGSDCVHFILQVLTELSIIKWKKGMVPQYPRDWNLHNTRELMLEGMLKLIPGELVEVDLLDIRNNGDIETYLRNGDIILSFFGKAASHVAFYYQNYFWHSLGGVGVIKVHSSDRAIRRQIKYVYRITV
jgi:cell wall-associated NlpC family hydrolase